VLLQFKSGRVGPLIKWQVIVCRQRIPEIKKSARISIRRRRNSSDQFSRNRIQAARSGYGMVALSSVAAPKFAMHRATLGGAIAISNPKARVRAPSCERRRSLLIRERAHGE
jgi:hypothetical protein